MHGVLTSTTNVFPAKREKKNIAQAGKKRRNLCIKIKVKIKNQLQTKNPISGLHKKQLPTENDKMDECVVEGNHERRERDGDDDPSLQ